MYVPYDAYGLTKDSHVLLEECGITPEQLRTIDATELTRRIEELRDSSHSRLAHAIVHPAMIAADLIDHMKRR